MGIAMRHVLVAIAGSALLLLAAGVLASPAGAADVSPPSAYGAPPDYGPPPYGPPYAVAPPPDYGPPVDYGPRPRVYGPPPYAVPYAAVRPACGRQWQCGPWGCGWRPVCYPQAYARSYPGYGPPVGPRYYGPY